MIKVWRQNGGAHAGSLRKRFFSSFGRKVWIFRLENFKVFFWRVLPVLFHRRSPLPFSFFSFIFHYCPFVFFSLKFPLFSLISLFRSPFLSFPVVFPVVPFFDFVIFYYYYYLPVVNLSFSYFVVPLRLVIFLFRFCFLFLSFCSSFTTFLVIDFLLSLFSYPVFISSLFLLFLLLVYLIQVYLFFFVFLLFLPPSFHSCCCCSSSSVTLSLFSFGVLIFPSLILT